jgi:hypothetical protein
MRERHEGKTNPGRIQRVWSKTLNEIMRWVNSAMTIARFLALFAVKTAMGCCYGRRLRSLHHSGEIAISDLAGGMNAGEQKITSRDFRFG